jgi:hypothetical protein
MGNTKATSKQPINKLEEIIITTFTTEDRILASGKPNNEEIRVLSMLMNEQYNEVKAIISHVKQKPLSDEKIAEMATQCMIPMFHTKFKGEDINDAIADALTAALRKPIYDFARALEEAHGIK